MDRVVDPLRLMGASIDDGYPPLGIDGGGLPATADAWSSSSAVYPSCLSIVCSAAMR